MLPIKGGWRITVQTRFDPLFFLFILEDWQLMLYAAIARLKDSGRCRSKVSKGEKL